MKVELQKQVIQVKLLILEDQNFFRYTTTHTSLFQCEKYFLAIQKEFSQQRR